MNNNLTPTQNDKWKATKDEECCAMNLNTTKYSVLPRVLSRWTMINAERNVTYLPKIYS